MIISGRPSGLPASGSRSPSPKTGSFGRPGDRNLQHWYIYGGAKHRCRKLAIIGGGASALPMVGGARPHEKKGMI